MRSLWDDVAYPGEHYLPGDVIYGSWGGGMLQSRPEMVLGIGGTHALYIVLEAPRLLCNLGYSVGGMWGWGGAASHSDTFLGGRYADYSSGKWSSDS